MMDIKVRRGWLRLVLPVALAASGISAAAQRPGDFRILGPGGGGAMYLPSISPLDPQTVLVSSDMTGAYITHDGGKSWKMFNLRGRARGFAFDPVDPKVIYTYGTGLWRSRDGGASWALLAPHPARVQGIVNRMDEGEVTILANDSQGERDGSFGRVAAFAIDPQDGNRMYAEIGSRLWSSRDGGDHWGDGYNLPATISHLAVLHRGGTANPLVVLSGDKGFWIADGGSISQLPLPVGIPRMETSALDVIGGRVLLLTVANRKLYQTWVDVSDKTPKVSWMASTMPGEGAKLATAASGHDGKTLYASFSSLKLDDKYWNGVAKSEDLGQHWTIVWKDAGQGAPNLTDGWMTRSFGSDWGEEPVDMAVADKDHKLLYATDLGRTLKSTDGGEHWTTVYSHEGPDGGAVSSGLDVLTSYNVYFDPFDAKRLFVGYSDVGLMRSENRGESWWSSFDGVPKPWRNTTYSVVFDPSVKGRVWAAMSRNHDFPRPRMWRHNQPSVFRGGVMMSNDGGVHWTVASTGMPEAAATQIVLDPKSPVDERTLYVATLGRGVFKSVDGGRNWVAKNQGITQPEVMGWRLSLAADGALYLVLARRSEDGTIGNVGDGALYRSRDKAETWERVALPNGVNGPNGLAVDPHDPARLYLAAWGRSSGQHGVGGGIFGTTDGGAHWTQLFGGDQHVFDVTVNPENTSELYATGFESSAWHSTDRGVHWQRIPGYNFKAGVRVTPDPAHAGMVFINTFGGGVWYGHVDGKPGVEDISSKEIAP